MVETLKLGRNDLVSDLEYHADSAISKHRLDLVNKSIGHYLRGFSGDSKALKIGRIAHLAILEPDLLAQNVHIVETSSERTKAFSSAVAEFPEKEIIKQSDFSAIIEMQNAVYRHPVAAELLDFSSGAAEISYCWNDTRHNLRCKCRVDYVGNDGTLIDIKTTKDAGRDFVGSAHKFRYPHQAAWYTKGVRLADPDIKPTRFLIIAVEKTSPFSVAVYEFSREYIDFATEQIERNLDTLADYMAAPDTAWTGLPPEIQTLTKPRWLT